VTNQAASAKFTENVPYIHSPLALLTTSIFWLKSLKFRSILWLQTS